MRILGIDPGLAIVGYCIVDIEKDENVLVTSGSIQTDKNKTDASRLFEIETDLQTIVDTYKPQVASIEKAAIIIIIYLHIFSINLARV